MREAIAVVRYGDSVPKDVAVLTFQYSQKDDIWVSECVELGTVTQAPTLEEARQWLVQAVRLQLNEVEELGFIDQFLRDRGVSPVPILFRSHGASPQGVSWDPVLARA